MASAFFEEDVRWKGFGRVLGWTMAWLVVGAVLRGFVPLPAAAVLGNVLMWGSAGVGLALFAFRRLRLVVDAGGIEWKMGPIRRRVAPDKIVMFGARMFREQARFVPDWGVWPAQEGPDHYTVWGRPGHALALVERVGPNKIRRHLLSLDHPEHAVAAILRSQGATELKAQAPSCQTSSLAILQ